MNYENIVADVKACLDMHKWPYSDKGVRDTVDRWLEVKGGVIDILRNHPQWNEDALAVVFDYDSMREIDRRKYCDARLRLYRAYERSDTHKSSVMDELASVTNDDYVCHQFVDNDIREHFKGYGINVAIGTKVSRVLGRYFRSIGLDKLENYNRDFADLSDALNPLKITRFSLLSVHPCDYLHMSHGTGWGSCHNIDNGCYLTGTLSYMGDNCSMIFYTVDKSYSGEARYFWREPKVNRQVYSYSENILLQSRLYPNCEDMDNYTNFRNAVQKIMSDTLGIPNYWTIFSGWDKHLSNMIETQYGARHYLDYVHDEYHANISLVKGSQHGKLLIGSRAYCVDCGGAIENDASLNCCGRYRCEECGEYITGRSYGVDGKIYCSNCVIECSHCGEYHLKSKIETVRYGGRVRKVCQRCIKQRYVRCVICGGFRPCDNDYVRSYHGDHVCNECRDRIVVKALEDRRNVDVA